MAQTQTKARVITQAQLEKLRRPLPKSLTAAFGLLKRKRKALERHIQTVRNERR